MNILIIGGNGFIGSHITDSLLEQGHSIRIYDRRMEMYREPLPGVDYVIGSFDDSFYLAEALQGMDAVIHLVSTTVPTTSNLDPVADVQSNLISSLKLLEILKEKGPKRILFLSSGGTVYGNPQSVPVSESCPLHPISSYGVVKVAIENYLNMYQQLYGMEALVLRASNPYGPRQGHLGVQGLIASFLHKIKDNQKLSVWGDGSIVRDFIYIEDLADLCSKAMVSKKTGIFNAGVGKGYSINEVVKTIAEVTGINSAVDYQDGRGFDVKEIYLDVRKACETFDWYAKTELADGIEQHWRWLTSLKVSRG